ncbi:MAG: hypothetical protein KGH62_04785, partial [Candidatus Micrarchaeota archaeon]|nr:hypothetical protein [Candidatus Micrarchaeota archaeon]
LFKPPKQLIIKINGEHVLPLGTAAGMDKNGKALEAFGNLFGFQEPGTVVIEPRLGNPRVRVTTLKDSIDLFNAPGFPSKGLDYFLKNISEYRRKGGRAIIYVSICGLPSEGRATANAMKEMEVLITTLRTYVDGFVWNPFSPNTKALEKLRTAATFYETGRLMDELAPGKLKMVKIGPYDETPAELKKTLILINAFFEGGGQGVVTTNTYPFSKEMLPESIREKWGYPTAGRSGTFLTDYMLRSINDIRNAFRDSVLIFGTGGISDGITAYKAFKAGANALEGYTPYVSYGPGLVRNIMDGLQTEMDRDGIKNLAHLQKLARR